MPILVYDLGQAEALLAHQRTIDTIVFSEPTFEARAEMLNECRRLYQDNPVILKDIDAFDHSYNSRGILEWYTRDTFLFRVVNDALRSDDVQMMFKMRYIVADLYCQLRSLHQESVGLNPTRNRLRVYRGQMMSPTQLKNFWQLRGKTFSIKTFFSASTSLQVALYFAGLISTDINSIPVLFSIDLYPYYAYERPYVKISQFSSCRDEDEVLIAMGSVFRVRKISRLDQNTDLPVIHISTIALTDIGKTFLIEA